MLLYATIDSIPSSKPERASDWTIGCSTQIWCVFHSIYQEVGIPVVSPEWWVSTPPSKGRITWKHSKVVSTQLCLSISEREFTIFEVPSTHPCKLIFAKSMFSEELCYCLVFFFIFYRNQVGSPVLAILPSMIKSHLIKSQHRVAMLSIVQQVSVANLTSLHKKNSFELSIIYSRHFTLLLWFFYWQSCSFCGHCWQSRSLWCLCWWRGYLCLKIWEFWYKNWMKELTIILTRDWNCRQKA